MGRECNVLVEREDFSRAVRIDIGELSRPLRDGVHYESPASPSLRNRLAHVAEQLNLK